MEAICQHPEFANASSLSQSLDIPAPTIYRWLDTLCEERFIAVNAKGQFIPGERFRNIIINSLQNEPSVTERRSILHDLSVKLNETVSLSIPQGAKLIYFDRLESHWPYQVNLKVGTALPLNCCASGKLYLSTLDTDAALSIFKRIGKSKSARNTITSATKFKAELQRIRDSGYALDNEEWFDDMNGAAVPIFADNGSLAASLSTHALATRKTMQKLDDEIPLMLKAAKDIKNCLLT